jgi:ATP-dependent protease HslVU (ClpYQ) peptidase subunit
MTCVVALKHNGAIYMGADSAGVGGLSLVVRQDPKIYRVGPVLFGFTTSFRMGQLLGHSFTMPERNREIPLARFMVTTFVDAVRNCLKTGGYAKKENERESAGTFLVAIEGRLFNIADDYQVGEADFPYDAVGCGCDLALGSLYTTAQIAPAINPRERLRLALRAAQQFSAGVREPFRFEVLK